MKLPNLILSAILTFSIIYAAASPLPLLSPDEIRDILKGKNKSGFVVGVGVGLPATSIQYIEGKRFPDTYSYGYNLLFGYQDFSNIISPLPRNFGGARASLEFNDTFHTGLADTRSNSILLNYDLIIDPLARSKNILGFILGVNIGSTYIRGYQGHSFSVGLKVGFSVNFHDNHRLEFTYRLAQSGPLRKPKLFYYSPNTIQLTYVFRFDVPKTKFKPAPQPQNPTQDLDSSKYLLKDGMSAL